METEIGFENTEPIEPIRYAQFETIEAYNTVNVAIIAYKDELTGGEYTRTNTLYAYNPEPEAEWDGYYYMPAKHEQVEVGLFEGVTLLDAIPVEVEVEEVPTMEWLKVDIQNWLTDHSIAFTLSMTKTELLDLIQDLIP